MNYPNIVFSESEKLKFKQMAEELEECLKIERKSFKGLEEFSRYPPLLEAIKLAKELKINSPFTLPNMGHWMFESLAAEWYHSNSKGSELVSKFSLAIEGLPYEENESD